jgi:hypothetical protein
MVELKRTLGALVVGSLMFSSMAGASARPAPVATQQVNPWAALSALSVGAPAATICAGSAAAAAQARAGCVLPVMDVTPPPPAPASAAVPASAVRPTFGLNPLALGLLALVAGIGIFLAVRDGNRGNTPT